MGYGWKTAATQEAPAQAERVPAGKCQLKIVKLIYAKNDGTVFKSRDDSAQALCVLQDNQARECAIMLTFSEKAGWYLAKILECAGADLEKMEKAGITPERFADQRFGEAQLLGRVFWADVEWKANNGKEYANITPLRQKPTGTTQQAATPPAPEATKAPADMSVDDIPF